MTRTRNLFLCLFLLLAAGLVTSCEETPVTPEVSLEVTNVADSFQLQATAMINYTRTVAYSWQNTGSTANVDQTCTITGGSGTLTIFDANGTEVYARSLSLGGATTSAAGVAGNWTIHVTFSNTDGTINFSAEKA